MHLKLFAKVFTMFLVMTTIGIALQGIFHLELKTLKDWVLSFGLLAPVVYGILIFLGLIIPFNPLSDFALVIFASYAFPPLHSITATLVANILAITFNYYFAYTFGEKILKKIFSPKDYQEIEKLIKKINYMLIITIRSIPSSTSIGFDAISYAAGIYKLPFLKFFLSSMLPWGSITIVFFVSTYILRGYHTALIFLPVVIFAFIPLIVILLKKRNII